jgi:hypothetical protein
MVHLPELDGFAAADAEFGAELVERIVRAAPQRIPRTAPELL